MIYTDVKQLSKSLIDVSNISARCDDSSANGLFSIRCHEDSPVRHIESFQPSSRSFTSGSIVILYIRMRNLFLIKFDTLKSVFGSSAISRLHKKRRWNLGIRGKCISSNLLDYD